MGASVDRAVLVAGAARRAGELVDRTVVLVFTGRVRVALAYRYPDTTVSVHASLLAVVVDTRPASNGLLGCALTGQSGAIDYADVRNHALSLR